MVLGDVIGFTWFKRSPMARTLHLLLVVSLVAVTSCGEARTGIRRELAGNGLNATVSSTTSLAEDAQVLLLFKAAITSDPFNVTKYWKPIGKRQLVNPCRPWFGITCTKRRVTAIDLYNQSLGGTLPTVLGSLSALQTLNLSRNHFAGTVPPLATSLRVLDLGSNNLTGTLPEDLTNLTSLVVSNNKFVGGLPTSFGNLLRLETLDVSSNPELSGTIPVTLGNLTRLEKLYLAGGNLTGTIPEALSNCTRLKEIDLSGNALRGVIPFHQGFGNLTMLHLENNLLEGDFLSKIGGTFPMLEELDVTNNRLSGSIPEAIGGVPFQKGLLLGGNRFNGSIPERLGALALVKRIDLSGNRFSGAIPESLRNCMSLTELNVASNELTGGFSIPDGTLPALTILNISHNSFNGSLPSLTHLVNLKLFDGSFNSFSGGVLSSFVSFESLQSLNVSSNHLSGEVPFFVTHGDVTERSFLNNSGLCGTVLDIDCGDGKLKKSTIVYIALGSAAGLVVVIILVFFLFRYCKGWNKGSKHSAQVSAELRLKFSPDEISAATNGFNPGSQIGEGKLGVVYRGVLPDETIVAVKRLVISNVVVPDADKALDAEFELLGHTRHPRLVKLLGYCSSSPPGTKSLVVEYMPHGNLATLLYAPQNDVSEVNRAFDWTIRFKIAMEIAEGLKYLHSECRHPVVHGDVKPSNILFDSNMEAKVADFGVKRILAEHGFSPSTPGTTAHGYTPSEVAASGVPSMKGDVYSFGIIMLEMITGRNPSRLDPGQTLPQWVRATVANSKALQNVLDPVLMPDLPVHQQKMAMLLGVALLCTRSEPQDRPHMNDVYKMLAHIKSKSNETSRRKGFNMSSERRTSSAARTSAREVELAARQPLPHNPSLSDWTPPSEV